MENSHHNDHDITLPLFIGGLIVASLAIFALIILFLQAISTSNSDSSIDQASGATVSDVETGANDEVQLPLIVGFDILAENGFSANQSGLFINNLRQFFSVVFPDFSRLSYKADSLAFDDSGLAALTLVANTGDIFSATLDSSVSDNDLSFTVYNRYGSPIFTFDSQSPIGLAKARASQDVTSSTIADFLPYNGVTVSGVQFSIRYIDANNLEIAINACDDETLKSEAQASAQTWLQSLNLPADDFVFSLPRYCDAEAT